MKYTIITEGRDNVVRVSHTDEKKFYERIRQDVRRGIMADFRNELTWRHTASSFNRYHLIPRVCPGAVLKRQPNGTLL
mgnify:CR=1 FL=1